MAHGDLNFLRKHFMILIWLRADLRTMDNPALHAACEMARCTDEPVTALYILSAAQWRVHGYGAARVDFERRGLVALAAELAALNVALKIIDVPLFGDAPQAISAFCTANRVTAVFANRQYEWNETVRDRAVHVALKKIDLTVNWSHDQCLVAPDAVKTGDGRFYSVFTPYKRNVLSQLSDAPPQLFPQPARVAAVNPLIADAVPETFGDYAPMPHLNDDWQAGETAAMTQVERFCEDDIGVYKTARDFPAQQRTSGLAAHLAIGSISPRQCWHTAQRSLLHHKNAHGDVETWISELIWRDFYRHVMVGFPRVSRNQPYKLETRRIEWRSDDEAFEKWCNGQTGYPIIDAAMRCLNQTNWMHNRLRMIVSMFLVKDLLIDWRRGEAYFAKQLIDFDLASNNGGWQWSASTGNDAVPYFRIFNPALQSQKFDPQGEFIKEWLPELRHLSAKKIHAPHEQGELNGYPEPMVNHSEARLRTLAIFKKL